jgi:hypothetical protein
MVGVAQPAAARPDAPATTDDDQYWLNICYASNPNVNGYFLAIESHVVELLDPASTGHAHVWVYCHYTPYVNVVTYGPLDKAITWHINPLPAGPLSSYTMPHQGWACPLLHSTGVVCNRSSC